MEIEQSILPKLLSAGLLQEGEQLCFKNEIGTVTKSGVILYKDKHYPSIVEWMKEIITRLKLFEECTLSTVTIHNQSFARYLDLLGELRDEVPKLVGTKSPDHSTFPKKRKRESMDSSSTDEEVEFEAKKQKSSGNHTSKLSSDYQYPPSLRPLACTFPNCLVCGNQLYYNNCTLTWSGILEVTLLGLRASYPEKQFFRMKKDIIHYVEVHWGKLSSKPRSRSWKATINATVSRFSEIFDGGYNTLKRKGYWRLKYPSKSFHRYRLPGTEESKNCNPPVGPKAVKNSATIVIDDGEEEPTTLGNYHRELSSSTSKTTVQSANVGLAKAAPKISPTIDADSYSNSCTSPATLSFNGDTSANTILDLSKRVLRLEQEQVRYTQLVASLYKKLDDNKKRTGQNNEVPPQFAQDPYPKYTLFYNRTQLPVNISVRNPFKPRIVHLHPLDNLM